MKRIEITFVWLMIAVVCLAQTDLKTYYATTSGLNKGELKTALFEIIKNPTVVGYDNLWLYFPQTDRRTDGKVWDMYSNNTYEFPDDGSSVSGMDKEHAFPKSWWSSGVKYDKYGCYSDLFNLNPADATANQKAKSNWIMGVVNTDTTVLFDNGVVKSGYDKNESRVWEPADEYKGDFARTYMYVVTCYEQICTGSNGKPTWSSTPARFLNWNSADTYPIFTDFAVDLLLAWHKADPVSEKELNRNETISKIQGNRNPFIDCPDFADYIWGDKKDEPFDLQELTGKPFFITPRSGEQYTFKGDTVGAMQSLRMQFRAMDFTNPVDWRLEGKTVGTFTLPSAQLSVSDLSKGRVQTLTYTSSLPARDTMSLVLSSDELDAPITIKLMAEARDLFQVLSPDIDDEWIAVRWRPSVDATGYHISMYQLQNLGEKNWQEKINEGFVTFPSGWTNSNNGFKWLSQNGGLVQLGSASNGGYIATPQLALGDSVRVQVRAFQTNIKDTNPAFSIWLDGATDTVEIGRFTVNTDTLWFATTVPNSIGNASVRIAVDKSNRTSVNDLIIDSYEEVPSKVAVCDTTTVGQSCRIEGLILGEQYLYTIQPTGGAFPTVFGPFEVTTGKTSIRTAHSNDIFWTIDGRTLTIDQLPANADIALYDALGRKVFARKKNAKKTLAVPLDGNGIYILRVQGCAPIKILKTR